MDIPNLFLIDENLIDNPYHIIGIENNSMVLSTEDMGCFSGDCFCCADDGSDEPTASLIFKYGKFEYSTTKSTSSFLFSEFDNNYPGPHVFYGFIVDYNDGDISGLANASRDGVRGDYQPFRYEKFILDATNSCGHEQVIAYCIWPMCSAFYTIDCNTRKIKTTKISRYIGTYASDDETVEEYYDLGNVPSISLYNNTGCGQPCLVEREPECIFTKNSLIYEFTDFKDYNFIKNDFYENKQSIRTYTSTGLSAFNRTTIIPLEVSDCSRPNTINAILPSTNTIVGYGKITNTYSYRYRNNYSFTEEWYDWITLTATYNVEYNIGHSNITLGDNFIFSWARIISYEGNFWGFFAGDVPNCETFLAAGGGSSDWQNNRFRCGYFTLQAGWKYSDETDDQYYYCDPAGGRSNCKYAVCGRTLIGKPHFAYSFGQDIGKITVYYDNL